VAVSVWGAWTVEDADSWAADIGACVDALHEKGLAAYLLYDASRLDLMKFAPPKVFRRITDHFSSLNYDIAAVYRPKIALFISIWNMMQTLYPSFKRIHAFRNVKEAKAFLDEQEKRLPAVTINT
jgi:hypothetical protein